MPTPSTDGTTTAPPTAARLIPLLADAYDLPGARLVRLDGQVSLNYRATTEDGRVVFVKHYLPGTDLATEREVIAQTALAGEHGVPVAAVIPSVEGEALTPDADTAFSVWRWMPGHTVEDGLTPAQQRAAGEMLGRVHAAFADHPAGSRPSPDADRWLAPDLAKREATVRRLLGLLDERPTHDEFDRSAVRTLAERGDQLRHVPDLLAGLPVLHRQVLHGDFSPKNLMFAGDTLTAVVDFGPATPHLAAWELGRIAFDPRNVVLDPDWLTSALTLVTAYQRANPGLPAADIHACARVALIQLLVSLYGVKEHYLRPGLHQADLDRFWLLRHQAATTLLDHLEEVETALAQATRSAAPPR